MTTVVVTNKVTVIQHSDGTFLYYDVNGFQSRLKDVTLAADFSSMSPGSIRRNHMGNGDKLVEYEQTIIMTPVNEIQFIM